MTRLCAALGAVVLAALAAFPAAADPISDAVERAYRPLLGDYDVPGMVVAVTMRGERRFFRYGVTAGTGRAPATEDTLFEIGSVSKTFTATLAAYAAALGKLSLDDHPGEQLPELRGTAVDRASLIELGAYAAGGLPLQFPPTVTDEPAMLAFFRQWTPTSKPGEQRRYSNPSVGLMGRAAATAMGGDFAHAVEGELLPKLGLAHTFVRVPDAEMGRYAWGHDSAGKPIRVAPGVFDAEAYGIKSTAADMLRFVEANIRPETLDPAMRSAVEATHAGRFRVGGMTQGLG